MLSLGMWFSGAILEIGRQFDQIILEGFSNHCDSVIL